MSMKNAQGVYFEDEKQWYHQAKLQNYPKIDGCYEPANGPQTVNGIDLKPFTSIVTKSYDKDTKLFIKELEGKKVDNGAEHNGCVQVVDNDTEDSDLGMYISTAERKRKYFKGLGMVTVTEKDDCDVRRYKLE
ncbi:hypothetical protein IWQ62_006298 [Dispira parvispora]|uniref:Uncharacterized protein n=1 Tax=Dispira parvispora TaxID=1520584 RepID=A0A9W8AGY7_9FUNG|nr:hypothetical protein IWQ62_006298 [Dispira parvispora]